MFKDASRKATNPPIQAPSPGRFRKSLKNALGYAAGLLPGAGIFFKLAKDRAERRMDAHERAISNISNSNRLDELYEVICADIARDMGLDEVRILRVEANGRKKLVAKKWVGRNDFAPEQHAHELERGSGHVSSICFHEKSIIHLSVTGGEAVVHRVRPNGPSGAEWEAIDVSGEEAKLLENARRYGIREKIAIPLLDGDEVIGVIVADNRTTQKKIQNHTIKSLAQRAAIASLTIKMMESAVTDRLTGLFNRRHFDDAIGPHELSVAQRNNTPCSVIYFDIDNFKSINDAWGHNVGDKVLKSLVETVSNYLRRADVFVRYGGEEFVILLPGTDLEGAVSIAKRVLNAVASTPARITDESFLPFTASFGVVQYNPGRDHSITDVVERADTVQYIAKKSGKNRIVVDLGEPDELKTRTIKPEPKEAS
ncbi:MAG: sensor domain-containing diguanylate cyclase [Candidatus Micrarchaeia archaeon]